MAGKSWASCRGFLETLSTYGHQMGLVSHGMVWYGLRHGKSSTPYLVSIVPPGYFGGTAGFLRSESLASPARSAEQSGDQKETSLKKLPGQILNSFKRRISEIGPKISSKLPGDGCLEGP